MTNEWLPVLGFAFPLTSALAAGAVSTHRREYLAFEKALELFAD